jgi:Ca2+-binding EF-hand superfamily protein
MGNGKVKSTCLKNNELQDFHNMTLFSTKTLIILHGYYDYYSAILIDDGVLDYDEFCQMVGRKDNLLNRRLFDAFDINRDGCINFREFLKFISTFVTGSIQDQYDISYKILSNEFNNLIEKDFIKKLIKEGVLADERLKFFIDERAIDELVNRTFRDASAMNKIQYIEMLKECPLILSWFKCDITRMKDIKKKSNRNGCCFSS